MNAAFDCEGPSPAPGGPLLSPRDARRIPRRGPLLLSASLPGSFDRAAAAELSRELSMYRPDLAVFAPERSATADFGHAPPRLRTEPEATLWLSQGNAVLSPRENGRDFGATTVERLACSAPPGLAVMAARWGAATEAGSARSRMQISCAVSARPASEGAEHDHPRLRDLVSWHDHALTARPARGLPMSPMARAEAVAEAVSPETLEREIRTLPDESRLLETTSFLVVAATREAAPSCVREIGRLREVTFRGAGEGTGRALDLDPFDDWYTHLFVFDKEARAIAGAYRLGDTESLLRRGPARLYTSTLFDFAPTFWAELGPALELGRSFVCAEYQKTSRTLLLLWKGIGSLVTRSGRRQLFGPVSVSAEYTDFSRDLMAEVLGGRRHRHPLAGLVTPRTPSRGRTFGDGGLGDPSMVLAEPADLSLVVSSAESDGKGIPVLVGEYLKLGGRFLGFNVDASFAAVLDGLVAVDLAATDQRLLGFYMGKKEAAGFLSRPLTEDLSPRA